MSNRQEKIDSRILEARKFLSERRELQIRAFERSFNTGVEFYEINKDKISEEERIQIEAMIEEQRAEIEKLKSEIRPSTEA